MNLGIAVLIGIAVWVALGMYYCGRQKSDAFDIRTAWSEYGTFLKTGKGKVFFLAGMAIIAYCLYMVSYYGESRINGIRNGLIAAWLIPVALIDAKEQIIPRSLTMAGFVAWLTLVVLAVSLGGIPLKSVMVFSLGGCVLGGGLFFLCKLITKGGVGMGDVRIFGVLGLLHGMNETFSIIFFTILLMTVYGLAAVLCKKKNMKSHVPMGPFILMSYILCRLLGV